MLTPEGRNNVLFDGIEDSTVVFHWHGDTFTLPEKSIHLLKSDICSNQAFLYNSHVLGLQFHFEATPDSVVSMLENDSDDLSVPSDSVQNAEDIISSLHYSNRANEILFILLDRFLNL